MDTRTPTNLTAMSEKDLEIGDKDETPPTRDEQSRPTPRPNPGPPPPTASRTIHTLYHLHLLTYSALGPGLSNFFVVYILPRILEFARSHLPDEPIYRSLTPELNTLGYAASFALVLVPMALSIWFCMRVLEPAVRRRGWALDQASQDP